MKLRLEGPWPLDPAAVERAADMALRQATELRRPGRAGEDVPTSSEPGLFLLWDESGESAVTQLRRPSRAGESAPAGNEPGLYLLWDMSGEPALAGFWLTFGTDYLDRGPVGPPELEPPFVEDLLTAATEAVWWKYLPVTPHHKGTWTPTVVMEWPAALAERSSVPPPGAPLAETEGREPVQWMTVDDMDGPEAPATAKDQPTQAAPWQHLPAKRSLLCVVHARLHHDGKRHGASYRMVPPESLTSNSTEAVALETWLLAAQTPPQEPRADDDTQRRGGALLLPGARAGFALSGWLTRELGLWPPRATQLMAGTVRAREVRSRWRAQAVQATAITLAVLMTTLQLGVLVKAAAQPNEIRPPEPPPVEPQPALSVCSEDHAQFMQEFRCQLSWLAAGASEEERICSDPGGISPGPEIVPLDGDWLGHRAEYCGLRDRGRDGWLANAHWSDGEKPYVDYARLAATKACFNVLSYPYTYEARGDSSDPQSISRADPARFFDDPDLRIDALVSLVRRMDTRCDRERSRMELQLRSAVLATHVGDRQPDTPLARETEAQALRRVARDTFEAGLGPAELECVSAGLSDGVLKLHDYPDLCGRTGSTIGVSESTSFTDKPWERLGPRPDALPPDGADRESQLLVERYTRARFNSNHPPQDLAWRCDATLRANSTSVRSRPTGTWDRSVRLARTYSSWGLVDRQLDLDAALNGLESQPGRLGVCWDLVAADLGTYAPVHPLLEPPMVDGWPSEEQQLCGQVCATRYRIRSSKAGARWVTPGTDLASCIDGGEPVTDEVVDSSPDRFDVLQLPWNGQGAGSNRHRTRTPARSPASATDICAFHLVAQGYLGAGDPALLADGTVASLWAGDSVEASRLAGGVEGDAAKAARSLSSYGRARSSRTCGDVAAQCFATGLLTVTDPAGAIHYKPYQWTRAWRSWFQGIAGSRRHKVEAPSPWCTLLTPYLQVDGALPEGQLDYPCAKGVDDTRRAAADLIAQLAQAAEAAP